MPNTYFILRLADIYCFISTVHSEASSPIKILTNQAFWQSPVWCAATTSICRETETPDSLPAWTQACRLFKRQNEFDAVVTMGPRVSLLYGLLCFVRRRPSKQIMTEVFLDEARPFSIVWKTKNALFSLVARRGLGVLTNSAPEIQFIAKRFALPEHKLRFVPMYTTIENPHMEAAGTAIFSAGRSGRDLATFFEAVQHISTAIVVITDKQATRPQPLPENVKWLTDLPLSEYLAELQQARMVVIPLHDVERSTGQVVLFEAMAFGKPIIATRAAGTVDYIRDGQNGLLVPPHNAAALRDAIQKLLSDSPLAAQLGQTALQDCRSRYTPDTHAAHKLTAIRELILQ